MFTKELAHAHKGDMAYCGTLHRHVRKEIRKRERTTYGFPLPFGFPFFSLMPDSRSKKDSLWKAVSKNTAPLFDRGRRPLRCGAYNMGRVFTLYQANLILSAGARLRRKARKTGGARGG